MSPDMVEIKRQQQQGNAVDKQIARRPDLEIGRAASARAARLIATRTSSRGALLMLCSGMALPGTCSGSVSKLRE